MPTEERNAPGAQRQRSRVGTLSPVMLCVAIGLLAGASELVVQAFYKFVMVRMVWTGWHALWMTPASHALLLVPLGLLLSAGSALWPRLFEPRLVLFAPLATASFAVLWLFYPALHRLAILVLALGLATAMARVLAERADMVERLSRRIARIGIVVLVMLALGIHGGRWLSENRSIGNLPPADARSPNVLIIVLDAVRARNLSLYGYERPTTPVLEAFAARGATFTDAWSTSPWTLPSHASMFTGRYAHEFTADATHPLERGLPTLAEALAARAYRTGGFVANVSYAGREAGLARGFSHFEDYVVTPAELVMSSSLGRFVALNPGLRGVLGYYDVLGRRKVQDITGAFLRWEAAVDGKPFFAFLNLYDAHEPYLPPDSVAARFPGPVPRRLDQTRYMNVRMGERTLKTTMPVPEQRAEEAAYDAAIATIDAELGRLFAELDRRGVLDRTITVITGDHGEMFGEHGLFSHGHSLYRPLLHVPLAVVYPPAVPAGIRVHSLVSLRDLPATILSLAGVTDHAFAGASLLPADSARRHSPVLTEVRPSPGLANHYPASRGVMYSIAAHGYQYIRDGAGREELYSLSDASQTSNLALDPALRAMLAQLRAELDSARVPD